MTRDLAEIRFVQKGFLLKFYLLDFHNVCTDLNKY